MTCTHCNAWLSLLPHQTTPYFILPPSENVYESHSEYYLLQVLLHLLFFFQTAYILHMVYWQSRMDIFLIDWEKPTNKPLNKAHGKVSAWRTIFVANEWQELQVRVPTGDSPPTPHDATVTVRTPHLVCVQLQTCRKTNVPLTIVTVVLILLGAGHINDSVNRPTLSDKSDGQQNIALRSASPVRAGLPFP